MECGGHHPLDVSGYGEINAAKAEMTHERAKECEGALCMRCTVALSTVRPLWPSGACFVMAGKSEER